MSTLFCKSFDQLATVVAKDFVATMKEEGFESFNDMSRCYMWNSSDIQEEIKHIIEDITNAYIDEDRSLVILDSSEDIAYKDFKKLVLSKIKEILK